MVSQSGRHLLLSIPNFACGFGQINPWKECHRSAHRAVQHILFFRSDYIDLSVDEIAVSIICGEAIASRSIENVRRNCGHLPTSVFVRDQKS